MGTSRSSSGAGPGVPLVPGWLEQPEGAPPPQQPIPVADPNRFTAARTQFGKFVDDGERDTLRGAASRYVNQGYGGSANAAARMSQAAATAAQTFSALSNLRGGEGAGEPPFDPALLAGRSIRDVIDWIVDAIRPEQTTLDDMASRHAIDEAISDVLEADPDADPMAFTAEQLREVFLLTLAYNVFEILRLDIGERLQANANGDPDLANRRLADIRDFVVETARTCLDRIRQQGRDLSRWTVDRIAAEITRLTMDVFAEDVQ